MVKIYMIWSERRSKDSGAEAKARRDDRTYIHDGYRELFEKALQRSEVLERRLTEQDLKIDEVWQELQGKNLENLELRSENNRLKEKIAQLEYNSKLGGVG